DRRRPRAVSASPSAPATRRLGSSAGEMGERDDPQLGRRAQSGRAARLMELLGLTEEELCRVLDVDPLTLLSGQLDHRGELPILLDLLDEASDQAGPTVLRRWVRAAGPSGRPIDALMRRDFGAFESALGELAERGFVVKGGGP
ncbi:MAG: hypothetical protein ACRDPA_16105, partial [Solirubrobacteraceae bacterium]